MPRAGKQKKEEEKKKRSTGPVARAAASSGLSFAFQCAASLRLLLIVRHGHCRASVHGVLPVPIRILVGVGGATAHGSRVKRPIPKTCLRCLSVSRISFRIIARNYSSPMFIAPLRLSGEIRVYGSLDERKDEMSRTE